MTYGPASKSGEHYLYEKTEPTGSKTKVELLVPVDESRGENMLRLIGAIMVIVLLVAAGVALWVAGFDIFYALQDFDYDREHGLHSIPSRFGVERSFQIVRLFHLAMVLLLLLLVFSPGLGWIYLLGVVAVAALLLYEHSLVRPNDLSRLDAAFFNMNGYISVTIFAFTLLDALL